MTGSEKYGTDVSTIPPYLSTYIFSAYTANVALRRHLYRVHALQIEVHAPRMEEPDD
jgi:hypothetical protein